MVLALVAMVLVMLALTPALPASMLVQTTTTR
jgi:hypothetical protein